MQREIVRWKRQGMLFFSSILFLGFLQLFNFMHQDISQVYAQDAQTTAVKPELRGVWISFLEWNEMPTEQSAFQQSVNQMFDNVKGMGMNAVFVHVRSDSDAMYPSAYFPWSKFASGTQGVDPGYDPVAYMIEAAHSRGLEFHAWINPYRVTGYLMGYEELATNNPARIWLTDNNPANDRWVLLHEGAYYYNPAIPEVKNLIIDGVREIVGKYPVDGIHFDDYFYPTVNNGNPLLWFDKPEYDASGSSFTISQWRRDQVNQLVYAVFHAVNEINPKVSFGISPAGNMANLRSEDKLFVDIDTWMRNPGYVDYIMPQLYWGFDAKMRNKAPAPYAYNPNLQEWINLSNQGNVTLYVGLAMSRAGTNVADNNPTSEWLTHQDILKRQVEAGRATGQIDGYCFFSYRTFYNEYAKQEAANLLSILK